MTGIKLRGRFRRDRAAEARAAEAELRKAFAERRKALLACLSCEDGYYSPERPGCAKCDAGGKIADVCARIRALYDVVGYEAAQELEDAWIRELLYE